MQKVGEIGMKPRYATVLDVAPGKGVKIKIDGPDEQEVDIYYNSLAQVNRGDRVYIDYSSGSIIIIGKLLY